MTQNLKLCMYNHRKKFKDTECCQLCDIKNMKKWVINCLMQDINFTEALFLLNNPSILYMLVLVSDPRKDANQGVLIVHQTKEMD